MKDSNSISLSTEGSGVPSLESLNYRYNSPSSITWVRPLSPGYVVCTFVFPEWATTKKLPIISSLSKERNVLMLFGSILQLSWVSVEVWKCRMNPSASTPEPAKPESGGKGKRGRGLQGSSPLDPRSKDPVQGSSKGPLVNWEFLRPHLLDRHRRLSFHNSGSITVSLTCLKQY